MPHSLRDARGGSSAVTRATAGVAFERSRSTQTKARSRNWCPVGWNARPPLGSMGFLEQAKERRELYGKDVAVAPVADPARMKLDSFRDKDRVHVRAMDAVGLITQVPLCATKRTSSHSHAQVKRNHLAGEMECKVRKLTQFSYACVGDAVDKGWPGGCPTKPFSSRQLPAAFTPAAGAPLPTSQGCACRDRDAALFASGSALRL